MFKTDKVALNNFVKCRILNRVHIHLKCNVFVVSVSVMHKTRLDHNHIHSKNGTTITRVPKSVSHYKSG